MQEGDVPLLCEAQKLWPNFYPKSVKQLFYCIKDATSIEDICTIANYELKFIIDHGPSQGGRVTFRGAKCPPCPLKTLIRGVYDPFC